MNKPRLKLGFIDYFKPIDEFFIDILSKEYEIIRNDENPECLIFCDENFGTNNVKFNNRSDIVKVFYSGENRRFWNYNCHFAITFDHIEMPFHYRLPLYVVDNWNYTKKHLSDIRDIPRNTIDVNNRFRWCTFVARNGNYLVRNDIFHKLSEYKQVHSGGPLFNNIGRVLSRKEDEFHTSKFDFLREGKFNLCYENGAWPGYVTEKLYHALYCRTIPIYYGSSTVALDFNPRAFIDRNNYETDEEMIDHIKKVDNNEHLYMDMITQPLFAFENKFFNLDRLARWFKKTYHLAKIQYNIK